MKLKNVTSDPLEIPALRIVVPPDGTFECPDELAGEVPGRWREPTRAEAAEGCRGLATRTEDGTIQVLSPGVGLLASRNYEPVKARTSGRGK